MKVNYSKKWRNTPYGRAKTLLHRYNQKDVEYGRGKGDLTAQWIIENIFSKPCVHCGIEGWKIIGCNRIDNSKPHTKDNVEPCCKDCNNKIASIEKRILYGKIVDQIDSKTGEVIHTWKSATEAASTLGINPSSISKCINGGYYMKGKWFNAYIYKNYMWKTPLS